MKPILPPIKAENPDSGTIPDIKSEPHDNDQAKVCLCVSLPINMLKTHILEERGHEIIKILSDSDDMGTSDGLSGTMELGRKMSHVKPEPELHREVSILAGMSSDGEVDREKDCNETETEFDASRFVEPSHTDWQDPDVTSFVMNGELKVTTSVTIDRIEYLTTIPSLWPIPRIPTAFVLDLCDLKFLIFNKKRKLLTPDALIKNKVHVVRVHLSIKQLILMLFLHSRTRIHGQEEQDLWI
jgi:hypothetical protein